MNEEEKEVESLDSIEKTTPKVEPVVEQLTDEVETPAVVEELTEKVEESDAVEQPVEETVVPAVEEPIEFEPKPKKKKPILLILLLLLLIIGAVVSIIIFKPFDKKKENGKEEDKKVVDTPKEIKSDYRMSGNSLEAFDLYFLKLENKEDDMVYSPLSIKYALEMLSEGSKGDTKAQLDAVIGDYKVKKYQNNNNMSFANAFFVRDSFKKSVKDTYTSTLTTKYGAEIIYDPFDSPKTVNDWVSSKTFKLIDNIVDDVSDKDFILVNALGIDMKWNNLIHCAVYEKKPPVPCYNADGAYSMNYLHEKLQETDYEYSVVSYPYMGEQDFASLTFDGKENKKSAEIYADFNRYDAVKVLGEENIRKEVGEAYQKWLAENPNSDAETDVNKYLDNYIKELNSNYGKANVSTDYKIYFDDNVKVFQKDLQTYDGTTLQYVGIMPKTTTLKEFINNSTAQSIQKLIDSTIELKIENFKEGYATEIYGKIPLFKYEYELDLMSDLVKLGVSDVFSFEKANLGNMLTNDSGYSIEEVKHKAIIEFSNEGIKAAAATMEGGLGNIFDGFNYLYEVPTIKIDMTFDKPYLYLIRDKDTNEVWFVGTVYNPIDK